MALSVGGGASALAFRALALGTIALSVTSLSAIGSRALASDAAALAQAVNPSGRRSALPQTPPAPFKPEVANAPPPDAWIFSGALDDSRETFSGTLLVGSGGTEFEFKLGRGATCADGDIKSEPGLMRLSEITCSDDRKMQALFVPQGGTELKVFGHVGDERFTASAHRLGTDEPEPRSKRSKAPDAKPASPVDPQDKPRDG